MSFDSHLPSSSGSAAPGRALTAAILVGVLAIAFEAYGSVTAMPAVAEQFGRLDLYDWAFTDFTIVQVFAIVLAGRFCDRGGVIIPLATGTLLFTLGLLGAGAAWSMDVLLVMRGVQGFGCGVMNVSLMVLVAQVFDEKRRQKLMVAFSFCWVLPSFIGPPLVAVIVAHIGWRWAFWLLLPVMAFTIIFGVFSLRRVKLPNGSQKIAGSKEGKSQPVPVWAAAIVACGAAGLQYAGHHHNVVIALGGLAALGLALPHLLPVGTFRAAPGIASVMPARGLLMGSFMASETYLLLVLTQKYGLSLKQAGLLLGVGAITWWAGSWVQAKPWFRLRRDQIITVGAICTVAGLVLMGVFVLGEHSLLVGLIVGYSLTGLGMGMVEASTSLAVMTLSPPDLLGRSTSSLQVSEGLGISVILGLAGSVYAGLTATESLSVVFGVIYFVAVVCAIIGSLYSLRIGPVRNDIAGV